jgi:hypothetical protein
MRATEIYLRHADITSPLGDMNRAERPSHAAHCRKYPQPFCREPSGLSLNATPIHVIL